MNKKEFLKELKDYFNEYEWKSYDEKRMMLLLVEFEKSVKPVTVIKEVLITRNVESETYTMQDVRDFAENICNKHRITMEQLKANSPKSCYVNGEKRKSEYIEARRDFCISIFSKYSSMKLAVIKRFLGYKCHSSIIHFLNKKNHGRKN